MSSIWARAIGEYKEGSRLEIRKSTSRFGGYRVEITKENKKVQSIWFSRLFAVPQIMIPKMGPLQPNLKWSLQEGDIYAYQNSENFTIVKKDGGTLHQHVIEKKNAFCSKPDWQNILKDAAPCIKADMSKDCIADILEAVSNYPEKIRAAVAQAQSPFITSQMNKEAIADVFKIDNVLGLDTWDSTGDKETAKTRIIECFRNSSEELNLSSLNLSSIPPKIWQYLPQLTFLTLRGNQLTTLALPTNMPNLTCLSLRGNRLTTLTLPTNMPLLDSLDLSYNQLTTRPNLDNCRNLQMIEIEGNLFQNTVSLTNNPLQPFQNKLSENSSFKNFSLLEKYQGIDLDTGEEIEPIATSNPVLFNQIHTWLDKLKTATDFKEGTKESQAIFVERIFSILDLATRKSEFRETFQVALSEALTSCVDRSALLLNSMELNKQIFLAKDQSLPQIATLLKGAYALEKIDQISTEFVIGKRIPYDPTKHNENKKITIDGIDYVDTVDPIEVYLGFQTRLKEEFNLPIITEGMNYSACSGIKNTDEKKAREHLRQLLKDKKKVVHFLSSVDVWSQKLKEEFPSDLEKVQEPFQKALESKMEEADFLKADGEVQKTLLEPITTAMAEAEQKWVEEKTLEILNY